MYSLYQSMIENRVESQQISRRHLLFHDLSEGPLCDILEFLDLVDLANAEAVCMDLRMCIALVWKRMDEKLPAPRNYYDRLLSAKDRVIRWTRASEYAERMERVGNAQQHRDHAGPYDVLHCPHCAALPELDADFDQDSSREFFVRLSYPSKKDASQRQVVWQGFVPRIAGSKKNSFGNGTERHLDFRGLSQEWPEMEDMLRYRADNTDSLFHDDSIRGHYNDLRQQCLEHLLITVVAVADACPWTCSLVATTGRVYANVLSKKGQPLISMLSLRHILDRKMTVTVSFHFNNAQLESLGISYSPRLVY